MHLSARKQGPALRHPSAQPTNRIESNRSRLVRFADPFASRFLLLVFLPSRGVVTCLTSHVVSCLMFHVSCRVSHVSCLVFDVACLTSHVASCLMWSQCLMSHVACLMFHVSRSLLPHGRDIVAKATPIPASQAFTKEFDTQTLEVRFF